MLGEKVREARLKAKLTQTALSKQADMQQHHLSKIENNDVDWIRSDTLKKLCDALHVTPNDLLGYAHAAHE